MTYFAVTRTLGESWDPSRSMREQEKWDEHAAFMNALADDGFVVLGGPQPIGSELLGDLPPLVLQVVRPTPQPQAVGGRPRKRSVPRQRPIAARRW
jgi:hypothetical protein